ncbi:MAG TPA: class I SAM-dependent methyltransferase [Bacteroidales bacterium]|nr:class I SAM-dependent methyltransferase [Bacteroidales bacterium]
MENNKRPEKLSRFMDFRQVNKSDSYFLVLAPLIEALKSSISQYANGKVLDIGCGNKPYQELFAHCENYLGCDVVQSSENLVDIICDASSIPLADLSMDTVVSTQTIEHVADYRGMLGEAFRILKKGGIMILSGPMYWHIHEAPHDYYRFTKFGFQYILENAGFEIVEINPNGGKWALFGQMVIHTLPQEIVRRKWFRKWNNRFFHWLDKKYFDDVNTTNYVVVAKKC